MCHDTFACCIIIHNLIPLLPFFNFLFILRFNITSTKDPHDRQRLEAYNHRSPFLLSHLNTEYLHLLVFSFTRNFFKNFWIYGMNDRISKGISFFFFNKIEISNITVQILGSHNPSGYRNDFLDDLDYIYDRAIEDDFEDDFVTSQRRYKERASAAFAEDMAELRRKRRDMQVIFAPRIRV